MGSGRADARDFFSPADSAFFEAISISGLFLRASCSRLVRVRRDSSDRTVRGNEIRAKKNINNFARISGLLVSWNAMFRPSGEKLIIMINQNVRERRDK